MPNLVDPKSTESNSQKVPKKTGVIISISNGIARNIAIMVVSVAAFTQSTISVKRGDDRLEAYRPQAVRQPWLSRRNTPKTSKLTSLTLMDKNAAAE